jgi:hypothetical protein
MRRSSSFATPERRAKRVEGTTVSPRRGEEVASSDEGDGHGLAATVARSNFDDSEHRRKVVGAAAANAWWGRRRLTEPPPSLESGGNGGRRHFDVEFAEARCGGLPPSKYKLQGWRRDIPSPVQVV